MAENVLFFPKNAKTVLSIAKLVKPEEPFLISERMSTRIVKTAAHLEPEGFLGWQMVIPKQGEVLMSLFGSDDVEQSDLEWISECMAKPSNNQTFSMMESPWSTSDILYELSVSPEYTSQKQTVGFASENNAPQKAGAVYPMSFFSQIPELIKAFHDIGVTIRYCVSRASDDEIIRCKEEFLRAKNTQETSEYLEYLGTPVRVRAFIRASSKFTLQAKAILDSKSSGLHIHILGTMERAACRRDWNNPAKSSDVLPCGAASILMLEPISYKEPIDGICSCKKPVRPIAATHDNTETRKAITIGQALDSANIVRDITIGEEDIRRHWQIIGQTGTGKSTLLATSILSAIKQGYGLTFFDPHGTTIDTILSSIPNEYINNVDVIHIGDNENPVPLSMWGSGDPDKEERTINELCSLLMQIFDPNNQGIAGPRWERWFSIFSKASLAFFGRFASFESIIVSAQSRENMRRLYDNIKYMYPSLASAIQEEYGKDSSNEFQNILNWYLCKLQRFTAISQLRKTLGAGINAIDFKQTLDTNKITLIDLAMPEIGKSAARVIGTLVLLQLWEAALVRKNRNRTHLVVLDEAQLFQTAPLPYMLAEGRKFGLGVILAHQHCKQMSDDVLDALEANSANFTAFRLSTKDATVAAQRFDDTTFASKLCRIDAYNAITTLSVDGNQSEPFTLQVHPTEIQKEAIANKNYIEQQSLNRLVYPYLNYQAKTRDELEHWLKTGRTPEKTKYPSSYHTQENQPDAFMAWYYSHHKTDDILLSDDFQLAPTQKIGG